MRGTSTLAFAREDLGLEIIEALPQTEREFRDSTRASGSAAAPLRFAVTFGSAIDFVLEMFQYRYASFSRYLTDFQSASGRHVDLVLAAMVDSAPTGRATMAAVATRTARCCWWHLQGQPHGRWRPAVADLR